MRWAGLAALATLVTACSSGTAPAPTVKVDRGPVSTSVAASGTLVAVDEQNIGFADRGKLAELMVKVGDKVTVGQPLARLDDGGLSQSLASAQAKLDQQKASLDKITGSNTVEAAQASLDSAQAILDATQANVDAVNHANSSATRRARVQLDFDRKVLAQAKAAAASGCPDMMSAAPTPAPAAQPMPTASAPPPVPGGTGGGSTQPPVTTTADPAGRRGFVGMGESSPRVRPVAYVTSDVSSCSSVQSAQRTVIASETALDQAENTENTAATQGEISVAQARSTAVDAQSQLNSANSDRPADRAGQEAAVRDAQIAVDGAKVDLENATLRAPVAGTISTVNGQVGEFIAAAGGATSLAPGSTARIPAAASTATSTDAAGGGGAAAGGAFITISNVDTFQLVVPFEESDAAEVAPNQKVDVSIDAVAGLTKPGTVAAIAPTSDTISGVVSYYATIVLNENDPRLKDGQTAQADVLTQTVERALRVPSATVRQENGRSVVTVPGPDGAPLPVPFTAGLVGDQFTEVTSGLQEGQDIVLPQAQVTATPGGGGPPNGGG